MPKVVRRAMTILVLVLAATLAPSAWGKAEAAPSEAPFAIQQTVSASLLAARSRCNSVKHVATQASGSPTAAVPAYTNGKTWITDCYLDIDQNNYSSAAHTLQISLSRCEGLSLSWDGYFGPGTASALRSFQSRNGLVADGVYGPATGAKIRWYNENGGCARWR